MSRRHKTGCGVSLNSVTNSKYAPRDSTFEPQGFGRVEQIRWKTGTLPTEKARAGAAQMQHVYALRIRQRIDARNWSAAQYAQLAGTSYDRLMKLLRGEIILRLEDIAMADLLVGEVSDGAIALAATTRDEQAADAAYLAVHPRAPR